jgi:hypothetical protein
MVPGEPIRPATASSTKLDQIIFAKPNAEVPIRPWAMTVASTMRIERP